MLTDLTQSGLLARLRLPGSRRRMLAGALVILIAAIAAWCLTTTPPPIVTAKKGGYTDVRLYHDIAAQVAKGRPFYAATAELQRQHHYPLKPFITVRQPTEVMFAARFGWVGVQYFCMGALFLSTFLWVIATEGKLHIVERIALLGAMGAGGSQVVLPGILALQEYPAGECIGVAMALWVGWRKQWWLPMIPILLGLFIGAPLAFFGLVGLLMFGELAAEALQ